MIQRVQSIFLAIVAIAMFLMIFWPIWEKTNSEGGQIVLSTMTLTYTNGEQSEANNTIYLTVLALLSSTVAVGSLFSFRNRMTQMKLNLLNSLLLLVTVCLIGYNMYTAQQLLQTDDPGSFQIGFFLPIVALFCNSLANRFIRKDEKLVRSVDRLR